MPPRTHNLIFLKNTFSWHFPCNDVIDQVCLPKTMLTHLLVCMFQRIQLAETDLLISPNTHFLCLQVSGPKVIACRPWEDCGVPVCPSSQTRRAGNVSGMS